MDQKSSATARTTGPIIGTKQQTTLFISRVEKMAGSGTNDLEKKTVLAPAQLYFFKTALASAPAPAQFYDKLQ